MWMLHVQLLDTIYYNSFRISLPVHGIILPTHLINIILCHLLLFFLFNYIHKLCIIEATNFNFFFYKTKKNH